MNWGHAISSEKEVSANGITFLTCEPLCVRIFCSSPDLIIPSDSIMRLSQNHNQLAIYTHVYIDDFCMTTTGWESAERGKNLNWICWHEYIVYIIILYPCGYVAHHYFFPVLPVSILLVILVVAAFTPLSWNIGSALEFPISFTYWLTIHEKW